MVAATVGVTGAAALRPGRARHGAATAVWALVGAAAIAACDGEAIDQAPRATSVDLVIGVGSACVEQVDEIVVEVRAGAAVVTSRSLGSPTDTDLPMRVPVRVGPAPGAIYTAEATWVHAATSGGAGRAQTRQRVLFPDGTTGRIVLALACACLGEPCPEGQGCIERPSGSGVVACVPQTLCGDGACGPDESCETCPIDCATCAPPPACDGLASAPCKLLGAPCRRGATACKGGQITCVDADSVAAEGTPCGPDNAACDAAGVCVPCAAGAPCALPDAACSAGALDCSTTPPTCRESTTLPAGVPCGAGKVCTQDGACAACAGGASCSPGIACQRGEIDCSSGSPQCKVVGASEVGSPCDDGASCTVSDTCDEAGVCVGQPDTTSPGCAPCSAGAPCAAGGACERAEIDCSTGLPVCKLVGPSDAGTPCDDGASCTMNDACNGSGACVGAPAPSTTSGFPADPSSGVCVAVVYYCCEGGQPFDNAGPAGFGHEGPPGCAFNGAVSGVFCQQNFCRACAAPDCSDCPAP